MRDLLIFATLLGLIPIALRRPMVAISVYIVISVMNPHQMTWGIARNFPWAWIWAAVGTVSAFRWHGDRLGEALRLNRWPLVFIAWTAVTTLFALDPSVSTESWVNFVKVQYGIVLALMCVRDMKDVRTMVAVLTASVAFYGLKGFIFMLGTGGQFHVNGPTNTLIADNNHLAVALIMVVPLLFWLVSQTDRKWLRILIWTTLVGCVFSALGTYSRGGFLALAVVALAMIARSPRKLPILMVVLPATAIGLAFMPDAFWDRMNTIGEYQADASATGRIQAWMTSLNVADARITGGGFAFYRNPLSYITYSPPNPYVRATHSIYFQPLGEHGWVGLGIFLIIFVGALVRTFRARRHADTPAARTYNELLRALQVSLLGYLTGGAFLSLAFWDFAYYLAATVSVLYAMRFRLREEAAAPAEAPAARRPNIFERPRPASSRL